MNRILIAAVSLLTLAGVANAQTTLDGHAQSDGRISIERAAQPSTTGGTLNLERYTSNGSVRDTGTTFTNGGYGGGVSSENVYSGK